MCRWAGAVIKDYYGWTNRAVESNNYGKKKKPNNMFVRVLHPSNKKNIAKSVTVLKLCERSFK